MFRDAYQTAIEFTFPVITSRRAVRGGCGSGVATFIVLNKDGWIATAGHVLKQWHKLAQEVEQVQATQAIREAIQQDQTLSKKERAVRLGNAIIDRNANDRCSAWWGVGPAANSQVLDISYIDMDLPGFPDVADIGVARLEPFDPAWVKRYPVFKDPSKNFEPGQSLCKLGFPFHQVSTSWNEVTHGFELAPGALPMPRFPIDGMFTRISEIVIANGDAPPFPFRYVETSSPGLLGQSGGPTFDVNGTVWAIQSKTIHHPLGFSGQSQFLNAGLGVHPATMFGFFDEMGLKYDVSDY